MALADVIQISESARSPRIKRWLLWCDIQSKHRELRYLKEEEHAAWSCLGMFQGEMAIDACEQDIDIICSRIRELRIELSELLVTYDSLKHWDGGAAPHEPARKPSWYG